MNVRECMSTNVEIASPEQSIGDAAKAMKAIDAGFLPVGENDRLIGMITDRDIAIRAVAEGKGPETPIREVMSPEVLYCFEDQNLADISLQMSDRQVRRLPVLNRDKRLVGVISLGDIGQSPDGDGTIGAVILSGVSLPGGDHVQR